MELFENWSQSKEALLEGLTPAKQNIVAPLLENQKKYLYETVGSDVTASGAIANFQKIAIPMIRRIIPGSIGPELVGVQSMPGPVSQVFSQRFIYTDAVAGTPPAGQLDSGFSNAAGDEVFGNNSKTRRFYSSADVGTTGYPPSVAGTSTGQYSLTADYEGFGGRTLSLETLRQTVTAGSRKIQARWSIESEQDLEASHGLNMQSEFSATLAAAVISDIDNEIINDLIALAGTNETFNMSGTFTGVPNYVGERHAVLGILINKVANEIGRKTRNQPGNWVVVSPIVATVLQSASKAVFTPAVQGTFEGPNGTRLVGLLNGTIKVYTYIYHDTGTEPVLVGFKGGNGELESGYFYCPFRMLESSGVMIDPQTTNRHLSLSTRYGKATFTNTATSLGQSADYYGKIAVSNLSFV
jgi:hypothetical protein